MIRNSINGLVYYTFENLQGYPLSHAVFTRIGGHSQPPFAALNVGLRVGDDPQLVETNEQAILEVWGLARQQVVTGRQVHGSHVVVAGPDDGGKIFPSTDGLATAAGEVVLFLRFADCVPIFLYDPRWPAVALGHVGWRGVAAGLPQQLVRAMVNAFSSQPEEVIAALGPAIGPCCYPVGEEVIALIKPAVPDWQKAVQSRNGATYLDLWGAISLQLREMGVDKIEVGDLCTAEHTDEFFSHRAERGRTGRFAALTWLGG